MDDVVKKILDIGLAIKEAVKAAWLMSLRRSLTSVWPSRRLLRLPGPTRESKGIEKVCGLVHTLTASAEPMIRHPVAAGTLDSVLDSLKDALALVSRCGKKNRCEKNTILQVITVKSESPWEEERYSSCHHGEVHRQETG
jgi:hypothetical protein